MAFAGISLVTADGKLCTSTVSPIDSRAASGYHLLAVEGFSRNNPPTGQYIRSRTFLVGGRRWHLKYYPNGRDSKCAGFISVSLALEDDDEEDEGGDGEQAQPVKVQSSICFIDQFQWEQSVYIHESQMKDFCLHSEFCETYFGRRSHMLERSAYLKDDSFIIRCDVILLDVKADINTEGGASTMAPSLNQVPPSDMSRHFKDLLLNKEGADVTFEVGGKTIPAHRCVLAARSPVFRAQLFGQIIQGSTLKIDGIGAKVFSGMLDFIYTDTAPNMWYWDDVEEGAEEGNDLEEEAEEDDHVEEEDVHIPAKYRMWLLQLLEAADRYDLHRLKFICREYLIISIQLSTVLDIIVLAEQRGSRWLKEECLEFIKTHTSLHKDFTAEEVEELEELTRTCSPSVLKKLLYKFAA